MRRILLIGTAAALLHATSARAAEADADSGSGYTYVDLMHFAIEHGGSANTLRGSLALGDSPLYATAAHYRVRTEDGDYDIDSLGLGYHVTLGDSTDLAFEAARERYRDADGTSGQTLASVGAFHSIGDAFEATVMLNRYFGVGDDAPATTFYLGGQRMLTANLSVVADVEFGDGAAWYGLGLRYFIH